MLDAPLRRALARHYKVLHILFLALLSSLVIYLVVGYVVASGADGSGAEAGVLLPVFAVMGLSTVAASFVLRGVLLRGALARLPAEITTEAEVAQLAGAAFAPAIVGWALCEAVAIYGLVLFFLTYRWELFLPFWGVSFVAMFLQAPSARGLENALRERPEP